MIKRTADAPLGVEILGPIHGILFIGYVMVALNLRATAGWDRGVRGVVLAAAVIPFGGYFVDRWLKRREPSLITP